MTAEQTAVRDAIVAMFLETGEDVYGPTRAFLRGMIKGGAL